MTRDDVLKEFHEPYDYEIVPGLRRGGMVLNTDAMADEIIRLRAILAMLKKPDIDVLAAAMTAWSRTGDVPSMLHAAITAAEREASA